MKKITTTEILPTDSILSTKQLEMWKTLTYKAALAYDYHHKMIAQIDDVIKLYYDNAGL